MNEIVVAIDPDSIKSAVAIYSENVVELKLLNFFELQDLIVKNKNILVIIEAGWLNKSNWHKTIGSPAINAEIGRRTGENHQTGKLLLQFCEITFIKHFVVKPSLKKLNSVDFEKVTGVTFRTNQDIRDAAMLLWRCYKLPREVKWVKK